MFFLFHFLWLCVCVFFHSTGFQNSFIYHFGYCGYINQLSISGIWFYFFFILVVVVAYNIESIEFLNSIDSIFSKKNKKKQTKNNEKTIGKRKKNSFIQSNFFFFDWKFRNLFVLLLYCCYEKPCSGMMMKSLGQRKKIMNSYTMNTRIVHHHHYMILLLSDFFFVFSIVLSL